jgi:hypothetical protein
MKIFEDMKEMGGTINDVIQKMINDMFHEELDDDDITDIVNKLSLSDLLALDDAYSMNDEQAVQDIIGPLSTMEYSMGGGSATSAASSRPAARTAAAPAAKKQPTATQSTSSYSGGGRNTTASNEPEPEDEEEPIEEGELGDKDWEAIRRKPGQSLSKTKRKKGPNKPKRERTPVEEADGGLNKIMTITFPNGRAAKAFSADALHGKGKVNNNDLVLVVMKDVGTDTVDVFNWASEEYGATGYSYGTKNINADIEEAGAPDYNPAAGSYNREDEDDTQYGIIHYPDTSISYIIRRPYEDWQHIYDPSYGYDGAVSSEDLDIAEPIDMEKMPRRLQQRDIEEAPIEEAPIEEARSMDGDEFELGDEVGFKDGYEQSGQLKQINGNDLTISVFDTDTGDRYNVVKSARRCWKESATPATNIVEMTAWLKRRAGME